MTETAGAQTAPRRSHLIVVQHHDRVPLGALAPALTLDADVTFVRGYRAPAEARAQVRALIDSGGYDGMVVLGGPMGVYEAERFPFLLDSLSLLEDALRRGAPILGLCLGSQLLSHALGSPVFPGSERGLPPEVGYFPARLTGEGVADPAATLYAEPDPVLFWHRDTHDLPDGAVLLATSDRYPLAAFRWGRWTYGFQFHLEITMEWLPRWIEESPLAEEAEGGAQELLRAGGRCAAVNSERATALGRQFVEHARAFREGL